MYARKSKDGGVQDVRGVVAAEQVRLGMRARRLGLAILYWFRARIGTTAPSRAGLTNLLPCQLVANR
jgi:hypothetical protein